MNHLVSRHNSVGQICSYLSKWTLSALQLHPWALIVGDEDATSGILFPIPLVALPHILTELRVKTVKYFKSIERVQDEVERHQAQLKVNAILLKQVVSTD